MPSPQPDIVIPAGRAPEPPPDRRGDLVLVLSAVVIVVATLGGLVAWQVASRAGDDAELLRARGRVAAQVAERFDDRERALALFLFSGRPETDPGRVPPPSLAAQIAAVARQVDSDEAALGRAGGSVRYRGTDLTDAFAGWSTEAAKAAARVRAGETLSAEQARLPATDPLLGVAEALGSIAGQYERAAQGRDDAVSSALQVMAATLALVAGVGLHLVARPVLRRRRRS